MVKDGLDLGEFSTKLLEKVEELTLHVIQLNEKTEQMSAENAELNKEIQKLKKQLK